MAGPDERGGSMESMERASRAADPGDLRQAIVNIVDAVLAAVLCVFAVRGYAKGLFREVFALLGLSVGLIVAVRYYDQASRWIDFWPYSPFILQAIFFIIFFLSIYISLNWVGYLLHRSADRLFLSGFNRFGGVLAGGVKGAVFLGVLLFLAISESWVPQRLHRPVGAAALVGPLYQVGEAVTSLGRSFTGVRWSPGFASRVPRDGV